MNWYSVFYWLTVSGSVKHFFDITSNIFTTVAIISLILMFSASIGKAVTTDDQSTKTEEEDKVNPTIRAWEFTRKTGTKLFYPSLVLSLLTWTCYVFTPTKQDCLLIVAGGAVGNFITSDSSSKQIPSDVTKFLHLSLQKEISSLTDDAKKQIGMQSDKDKFLEKAKDMTKEQIIEYFKKDTTLAK